MRWPTVMRRTEMLKGADVPVPTAVPLPISVYACDGFALPLFCSPHTTTTKQAAAGPAAGSAAWRASCGSYCTRQLCWSWLAPQPPRCPHPAHIGTKCEAQCMLTVVIHSTGLVSCEASHPVLSLWHDKSCQVQ